MIFTLAQFLLLAILILSITYKDNIKFSGKDILYGISLGTFNVAIIFVSIKYLNLDQELMTKVISPIIEELAKALTVFLLVYYFKNSKLVLVTIATIFIGVESYFFLQRGLVDLFNYYGGNTMIQLQAILIFIFYRIFFIGAFHYLTYKAYSKSLLWLPIMILLHMIINTSAFELGEGDIKLFFQVLVTAATILTITISNFLKYD